MEYTTKEAADQLDISPAKLRSAVKAYDLVLGKFGGLLKFTEADIEHLAKRIVSDETGCCFSCGVRLRPISKPVKAPESPVSEPEAGEPVDGGPDDGEAI